jgi:membrane-bound lytic murein transglycosylase MltF
MRLAGVVLALLLAAAGVAHAQSLSVLSLPGVKPFHGDLDALLKRRAIRILIPPSKTFFFLDKGEAYGITVELVREFEKSINKKYAKKPYYIEVVLVPTRRDRLFQDLAAGKGDIAAGNLTITPERAAIVDFADPTARGAKEVLVTGPSAPNISALADLSGQELTVRAASSYHEHLLELNKRLQDEKKKPIKLTIADAALDDEDLLEMVGAGLLPWTVVDLHMAKLWARIYKGLTIRENVTVHEGGDIAWALPKNTPKLRAEVNEFMAKHRVGTEFGDGLVSQYFNDGKIVKNALTPEKSALLRELMIHFQNYGSRFGVDPFILAAQGFQESGFDQKLRMKSGAVGVMQMKPSTARDELGINDIVTRAEDKINSAAAYLR